MKRFNLSAWAVSHPALILFLMMALGVAGFFSYQRLGRAEDPFFTVKVVNVSAIWPGATAAEMQTQVADPIEKKLQELPYFEKVQTYSKPAFTAMQVTFQRLDAAKGRALPVLSACARSSSTCRASLPAGLLGPVVNDEFSDVDSILYMMTGDGADYAQLKKAAEGMRQRLLKVAGRHQGRSSTAPRTSASSSSSRMPSWRRSASRRRRCSIRLPSRTTSCRPARSKPPRSACRCASPARSTASRRSPRRRSKATAGCFASAISPPSPTAIVDPPSFMVRQEGKPAIGIGVVTAKGANILELGKDVAAATAEFMKAVPQGINVDQIADQPKVVEHAVGEFVHSFIEALAIVLFVSLPGARLAHRHRGRGFGAAGARDRLHRHERDVARSASHHARRADHRARATGRRRHHRGRDDGGEDGAGLGPRPRGVLCLGIHRVSDADGNAGDGRGIPADRLCQFGRRRICRRHLLDRGDLRWSRPGSSR